MADNYSTFDRTHLTLTNVSNSAVEVYDNNTSFHFGPGEKKSFEASRALRLNSQDGRLKLPDLGSNGNQFLKEIPGSSAVGAQKV